MLTSSAAVETGIDAAALKPTECDVSAADDLPFDSVTIDYEGREHVPDRETLAALADDHAVRLTTPVRADGYDPLGDDSLVAEIPDGVRRVLVAGNSAYLTRAERGRAIAPRLAAAVEGATDAWVGTEGIERLAMATGATQFDLLSRTTEREVRALRHAGFDGEVALYAPTVLTDDEDAILDAVGGYVARRSAVSRALPDGGTTDSAATGRAREVLLAAADDYALTGTPGEIREQVAAFREAGVDTVVGYPARGVAEFRG
ncbi:luciferase [Halobacteriaceae archaeon GCM10025711]